MMDLHFDRANANRPTWYGQLVHLLVGVMCACGVAVAPARAYSPSMVALKVRQKAIEQARRDPFENIPKGPLQIVISINQQKLHLYSDGTLVADAPVATGVPSHPTPMGVFSVIDKDRFHRSNIYSAAPMPYMQRITWSGVAIHAGVGLGHPASHGCIRISRDLAAHLWALTKLGARVIIARPELTPDEFANPHLFVHQSAPLPPQPGATPATVEAANPARSLDRSQTADTVAPVIAVSSRDVPAAIASIDRRARVGTVAAAAASSVTEAQDATLWVRSTDNGTVVNNADGSPAADAAPYREVDDPVPIPFPRPAEIAKTSAAKVAPITIFISRKEMKIYVRQNFKPLFDAPIAIERPDEALGTHVFTALSYLEDGATLRWNVISLPGEPPKQPRNDAKKGAGTSRAKQKAEPAAHSSRGLEPPQTPSEALGRIEIPQDVIGRISQLIGPGSSLIISDQDLGPETGRGTDFIVLAR